MSLNKTMNIPKFSRPEVRLAFKITSSIVSILLSTIVIFSVVYYFLDLNREEAVFE